MARNTHPRNERWIRGVTSKRKPAFVFARMFVRPSTIAASRGDPNTWTPATRNGQNGHPRPSFPRQRTAHHLPRGRCMFVAEAASPAAAPLEAAVVESQGEDGHSRDAGGIPCPAGRPAADGCLLETLVIGAFDQDRSHDNGAGTVTFHSRRRPSRRLECAWRAARRARRKLRRRFMAHLLFKQCRSTAQGTGRTRLVEANASRPGAVAADRFQFGRRHSMQASAGGATRVYVHGHVKWRTVPTRAARPSTHALSFRRRFASTLQHRQMSAHTGHSAASRQADALS